MANPLSTRKKEIILIERINALKKLGSNATEKEIRELEKKEKQLKVIRKEHAAINKVREEGERKIYNLTSQVEMLQKSIGKVINVAGKDTVKWSDAAFQTGIATLGVKNNTDSIHGILKLLPGMMNQFAEGAANVVDFMDEENDLSEGLLEKMREKGRIAGTMVDFRTKEGKATRDAVSTWGELRQVVGQTTAEMVAGLGQTIESSAKLLINLDEIGTGSFVDMVGEMEKQERLAERNLELWEERKVEMQSQQELLQEQLKAMGPIENMTKEQRDLYDELNKQLEKSHDTMKKGEDAAKTAAANARTNVKLAKEQKIQHEQITAAVGAVSAPFEKMKSAMEALPFGNLISSAIGLGPAMDSFKDSATDAFKQVQAGTMTQDEALTSVVGSAQTMIKTLVGGLKQVGAMLMANPMMIMVVAIIAVGMALKDLFGGFTELRKEMGLTFGAAAELQSNINITAARFKFMGVSAEDVKGVVGGIQENWGGVGQATEENISLLTGLNAEFGISGEHSSKLITQMMAVGAGSREAAAAQLESVGNLALASGVAPAAIMADVAENTEFFAGFAKDGGMNLIKTSIAAKKTWFKFGICRKNSRKFIRF